jgi:hypothetical protein
MFVVLTLQLVFLDCVTVRSVAFAQQSHLAVDRMRCRCTGGPKLCDACRQQLQPILSVKKQIEANALHVLKIRPSIIAI